MLLYLAIGIKRAVIENASHSPVRVLRFDLFQRWRVIRVDGLVLVSDGFKACSTFISLYCN